MSKDNFQNARNILASKNLTLKDLESFDYMQRKKNVRYFLIFAIISAVFFSILASIVASIGFKGFIIMALVTILFMVLPLKIVEKFAFNFIFNLTNAYNPNDELNAFYFLDKNLRLNPKRTEKFLDKVVDYKNKNK